MRIGFDSNHPERLTARVAAHEARSMNLVEGEGWQLAKAIGWQIAVLRKTGKLSEEEAHWAMRKIAQHIWAWREGTPVELPGDAAFDLVIEISGTGSSLDVCVSGSFHADSGDPELAKIQCPRCINSDPNGCEACDGTGLVDGERAW